MEAAKMAGMKTGLVVSSIMNHATPAAFSSHTLDRNAYDQVAEQQVGYSHPLNISVDLLLGGGACYFKPASDDESCREDDVDLYAYAESVGYSLADDRAGFQALQEGSELPILGLFNNDNHLAYEVDRLRQPDETREPSLSELVEFALPILSQASACESRICKQTPGFFIMIEASRIDHASHVHDSVAHLGDVREYNKIIKYVKEWIDAHPDTAMISVADHETGGMTLPRSWDPSPLANFDHSVEYIANLYAEYAGDDNATYTSEELLPMYGLLDANETDVQTLMDADHGDFGITLADLTNLRTGIAWSTDDHTGVDVTLYAYAHGEMGVQLRKDLAGHHENTALPRYIEKALGLDIDEVTRQLRAQGTDWIP